jgi:hypothetical protein
VCDYSLMAVPNRLAREGEELVLHRFPTGSLGLAAPGDVKRATQPKPLHRKSAWQSIRDFFDPPAAAAVCAVCIPPGATLEVQEIPERLQRQWSVTCEETAIFTQISANVNTYRDALRFNNGREVRLQDMREGMKVRIVNLTGAEERVELRGVAEVL